LRLPVSFNEELKGAYGLAELANLLVYPLMRN